MAESYRGLTIRIGGDTTSLNRALRTANGALGQTQAELRKVNQALKLDPGNIETLNLQMGYMSNQATNTAMKLAQLKDTARSIGKIDLSLSDGTTSTIAEFAKSTGEYGSSVENVAARLSIAKEKLGGFTASLGSMHNEMTALVADAKDVAQMKIENLFKFASDKSAASIREIREEFEKLPDGTERTEAQIDRIVNKIEDMASSINIGEGKFDASGLRKQILGALPKGVTIDEEKLDSLIAKVMEYGQAYEQQYAQIKALDEEAAQERMAAREAYLAKLEEERSLKQRLIEEELAARRKTKEEYDKQWNAALQAAEDERKAIDEKKAAEKAAADAAVAEIKAQKKEIERLQDVEEATKKAIEGIDEQFAESTAEIRKQKDEAEKVLETYKKIRAAYKEQSEKQISEIDESEGIGHASALIARNEMYQNDTEAFWLVQYADEKKVALLHEERANELRKELEKAKALTEQAREYAKSADDSVDANEKLAECLENQRRITKRLREEQLEANRAWLQSAKDYEQFLKHIDDDEGVASYTGVKDARHKLQSDSSRLVAAEKRADKDAEEARSRAASERIKRETEDERELREEAERLREARNRMYEEAAEKATELRRKQRELRLEMNKAKDDGRADDYDEAASRLESVNKELERHYAEREAKSSEYLDKIFALEEQYDKSQRERFSKEDISNAERLVQLEQQQVDIRKASNKQQAAYDAERAAVDDSEARKIGKQADDELEASRQRVTKINEESNKRLIVIAKEYAGIIDETKAKLESNAAAARRLTEDTIKGLSKFGGSVSGLSSAVFNHENENVDASTLRSTLRSIAADLGLGRAETDRFVEAAARLKSEFDAADEDVKQLIVVQQYQDLIAEATKSEAAIKSLSRAIADMEGPSKLMRDMAQLTSNIEHLDSAYKEMSNLGKNLLGASEVDEDDRTFALAMNALAAAETIAAEKASLVRKELEAFDASEVAGVTDNSKSAAQQLYDAGIAAEKARERYEKLNGEVQRYDSVLAKLSGEQPDSIMDPRVSAMYEEAQKDIDAFMERRRNAIAQAAVAAAAEREASEALDGAKMRSEYEHLTASAATWTAEVIKSRDAIREAFTARYEGNILRDAFGDIDGETSALDSALNEALNRFNVFKRAFEASPDNQGLFEARMRASADVIDLATKEAERFDEAASSVDTSRVDELREKYGSLADAIIKTRDPVIELRGQLAELLAPKYFNSIRDDLFDMNLERGGLKDYEYEALPKKVREIREELLGLARDYEDALKANKMEEFAAGAIKAREAIEKLGDSFQYVDKDFLSSARKSVAEYAESAGTSPFGDVDTWLRAFDSTIESARARIKEIDDEISSGGDSDTLMAERIRLVDTVAKAASDRIELLNETIEQMGGQSKIDELVEEFGSVDAAIILMSDDAARVDARLAKLGSDVDKFASENNLGKEWAEFFKNLDNEIEYVPEELKDVREEMLRLSNESRDARIDLGIAAETKRMQEFARTARETGDVVRALKDQSYEYTTSDFLKTSRSDTSSLVESFGTQPFEEINRQVAVFDAAIDAARAKVKQIDDEMSRSGESDTLLADRFNAVEAAATSAEQRTMFLLKTIESMGGTGSLEKLVTEFGSVDGAVITLSESVSMTASKIAALESRIDEYANDNNLGKEWADAFKDLDTEIDEIPEELEGVREALADLWSTLGEKRASLGIAAETQQLEEFVEKARETGNVVRDSLKVKASIELDDSFSKEFEQRISEMTSKGFKNTGADELIDEMLMIEESVKDSSDYFEKMKRLLKEMPEDAVMFEDTMDAAATYVANLMREIDAIKESLDGFDMSTIDRAAIGGGTTAEGVARAKADVESYKKKVTELESSLKDAKKALDALPSGADTTSARSEVDRLEKELDETKQAANEAGDALERALNSQRYADIASSYTAKDAELTRVLNQMHKGFSDKSAGDHDQAAFIQSLQQVSQYAERAGRAVVESANTIDAAYRDMRKTVNGTEEQFESLRQKAIEFSKTHAVSADTILEMESLGGQMGVVVGALQDFGETTSNLEIATDMEANDIALKLGQITNVMGDLDESTFDNFADALVRLGNNTAAQESSIMNVAQRMSSVANVAKMSTPDLLAWSAAIASTGQRSESAATAINNTIEGIAKAVASGGANLQNFASIAGMSAEQFKEAWNNTPTDALKAFIKGLQNLSETNTGAIEALDNMGISSVRQETALLGLASTVDTLDDALEMSKSAFNGGGDAAREAAQKSEGFSGHLKIMQNNAADLAASLGDGLLPAIDAITGVLQALSGLLEGMPGPMKTSIVAVGGLTAAIGTLAPMLQQVTKGWKEMADAAVADSASMGIFQKSVIGAVGALKEIFTAIKKMPADFAAARASNESLGASFKAMGASAQAAGVGVKALATSLLPLLAITAVVAVIGTLVDAYNEWAEHEKLVKDATVGLDEAIKSSEATYSQYSQSVGGMVHRSADEIKQANEDSLRSMADFSKQIGETMKEAATNSSMLERYATTIGELGSKSNLSKGEIALLKEAVSGFNDIAGTSIAVIDEQTGKLNAMPDAINAVTEAYKEQALQKAYVDLYTTALEKQAEAEYERDKSQIEYNEILNGTSQAIDENITAMDLLKDAAKGFFGGGTVSAQEKYVEKLSELQKSINDNEAAYNSAGDAASHYESMINGTANAVSEAARVMTDYSSALASAGMDTSDFTSLSDEEKAKLNEVQAKLVEVGMSLLDYGDLNKDQLKQIAAAWNGNVNDVVAAIKQIQAAAAGAGGAVDYKAAAKEHKKMRDKEYDDTKKALDKEYKEAQKSYDAEYKAASKASQKYLKEFKAAQDEQVKAFKAATDAKLKEIDREYEHKQSLLDAEYQGYDNGYDEQIEQIKAEQEAEDKARERAEREEKLAELEAEVAKARGNKKAEAEKKLSEYKKQLDYEDRKAERDNQIKSIQDQKTALKEQYDNRKEMLKKSRDDAVESYKAQREKEQEIMTKANEAEYEAEQELEQAKLENMKAAQQAELESRKEANDQYLADHKAQTEQEVANIKAGLTAAGEAVSSAMSQMSSDVAQAAASTGASMDQLHQSTINTAKLLMASGKLSMEEYLNVVRQVPGSVGAIFSAVGITADNGFNQIAEKLLQSGQITQEQYDNILAGVPDSTEAIFTEAGLRAAYQIGLIKQDSFTGGTEAGAAFGEGAGSEEAQNAAGSSGSLLKDAYLNGVKPAAEESPQVGDAASGGFAAAAGSQDSQNSAASAGKGLGDAFIEELKKLPGISEIIGNNFVIGLINGLGSVAVLGPLGAAATALGSTIINALMGRLRENSPSKAAFEIGDYFGVGLVNGLDGTQRDVASSADGLGRTMLDAFDPSKLTVHADPVQEIIDTMRSRESDLLAQSQKMAEIVERGFDPKMSIAAAYEAMDRIDACTLRRQQLIASNQSVDNSTYAPVININIPEMVVREEADVDAISRQIATRVQRVMSARLG